MPQIPLPDNFYEDDSLPISAQNLVNFFLNIPQTEGALSQVTIYGTQGIEQITTAGATSGDIARGFWEFNDTPYLVSGTTLYSVDRTIVGDEQSFSVTSIGTIAGEGRVSMANNETQLMIINNEGTGYIYNGTTLSTISDLDFSANGTPEYVVFIDGYFVVSTDEKKFIVSSLNDGTAWNALDFGTAESDPDKIVGLAVNDNKLYVVGNATVEGQQNIGGAGFPFQRDGTFLDKGCSATHTLINANRSFFMVGGSKTETPAIWMFRNNEFTKISTTAIDNIIAGYTDTAVSNAFAMAWAQSGAYFVAFTFPERTFVFDMVTNKWHERTSFYNDSESRWRVNGIVKAYNKVLCCDNVDGRVGELKTDVYGEYSGDIHSYFTTRPFANDTNPVTVPYLELTCESGVGNSTVGEPEVYFSASRDNKNFSNRRNRSLGKIGEYDKRQIWKRNGRFSRFVSFRFGITDQVKKRIIKLETR